jgi:hypothetical protein
MSKDEIAAKARDLTTPVLGADTYTKLMENVFALEQMNDVRGLRPLLQRGRQRNIGARLAILEKLRRSALT